MILTNDSRWGKKSLVKKWKGLNWFKLVPFYENFPVFVMKLYETAITACFRRSLQNFVDSSNMLGKKDSDKICPQLFKDPMILMS